MIERLRGKLLATGEGRILLEVQGIGLRVHVSAAATTSLPRVGEETVLAARMLLHREEAVLLYGFAGEDEAELFDRLRGVSGVGPSVALNLLALGANRLRQGIRGREVKLLQAAPGVGAKLARRLITELSETLPDEEEKAAAERDRRDPVREQLATAFANLQFSDRRRVEEVLEIVMREMPEAGFQDLFRAALRRLSPGGIA